MYQKNKYSFISSKDRDVRVFATSEEMLTAIVNKSF